MVLMKAADDRLSKGIGTGEFMCVYWPSRGQEAIAAAMGVTLRDDDQLVTTYRGLHDLIGKGVPLEEIYGEMMGRTVGASRGKGGTMHIAKPEKGVMLSTGIVGAGPPVAVGLAMAAKRKGLDRVTVVSFGDGATNTGSFHEAANMAALWDLPMVFVCQNNLYAEMTPTTDTMKIEHVADRAAGYGMPGVRVDGNDPLAVRRSARRGDRQGPRRRRSHLHRVRHVPLPRPLLRRPDALHPQGAAGGGDGGRPGSRVPPQAHRRRSLHRRRAQRHRRGRADRGRGGARRRSWPPRRRRSTSSTETCTPTPITLSRLRKAMDEKEMTMREALNLALDQAMAADDRVFLLGEDIADPGASGPTAGLSTKYGHDRVLDTPISEAAIVGAAIGAAIDGLLPVAEIMIMDFIGIAADQLINNAAKLRFMTAGRTTAPITVRTQVYGGLATGATHSQTLEAWFMHIPGMKVIVPSTPRDGKGLLASAIFDEDPCLFVETIRLQGQKGLVPTDPGFRFRSARPTSSDPAPTSPSSATAAACSNRWPPPRHLEEQGVSAEVIDLRTLVPLDVDDHGRVGATHPACGGRARRGPVRGSRGRDRRRPAGRVLR